MPLSLSLNQRPSIRLTGAIDTALALSLLDEMALLHDYYHFREIELQINSPGGEVSAIHLLAEELGPWRRGEGRVLRTVAVGQVASAAALLLSFGTLGHRIAIKHSRLLYHPARTLYQTGTVNTSSDLKTMTQKLDSWDCYFLDLLAEHNCPLGDRAAYKKKLRRLFEKDVEITAEEAVKLRLVDRVQPCL